MAPSGTRRKPRRTHLKNKLNRVKNGGISAKSPVNSTKIEKIDFQTVDFGAGAGAVTGSPCSTPKAKRFQIPEIKTCPPAPKKKRVVSGCSVQRSPIAFFIPPDLELFFLFGLRDISV